MIYRSNIKRYGYAPQEVISEFSNLKKLEDKQRVFRDAATNLEVRVGFLTRPVMILNRR
jgi:hypothetical protein